MSISAAKENLLTLAHRLGLAHSQVDTLMEQNIRIVHDSASDHIELAFAVQNMLSRSFTSVELGEAGEDTSVLIVIGDAPARAGLKACYAQLLGDRAVFVPSSKRLEESSTPYPLILLAACYLASNCVRELIPGVADGHTVKELVWDEISPGVVARLVHPVDIGHAVLVGAGAIGNSFCWALGGMNVEGILDIIDDDIVSAGNLNRNVLHTNDHLLTPTPKAIVLQRYLETKCENLVVNAYIERFESFAAKRASELRIPMMITAVDSPRLRRLLQSYLPREIYDASTGGLGDIVFHHNEYPIDGACLACIYAETPDESARDQHISRALGVSAADLAEGGISQCAAEKICNKHPTLSPSELVGASFHSLFKQLCGAGQLPQSDANTDALEATLAPLCFVSALAGIVIAIELALRGTARAGEYNYFRISPWASPHKRMKRWRGKTRECEFCSDQFAAAAFANLWEPRAD